MGFKEDEYIIDMFGTCIKGGVFPTPSCNAIVLDQNMCLFQYRNECWKKVKPCKKVFIFAVLDKCYVIKVDLCMHKITKICKQTYFKYVLNNKTYFAQSSGGCEGSCGCKWKVLDDDCSDSSRSGHSGRSSRSDKSRGSCGCGENKENGGKTRAVGNPLLSFDLKKTNTINYNGPNPYKDIVDRTVSVLNGTTPAPVAESPVDNFLNGDDVVALNTATTLPTKKPKNKSLIPFVDKVLDKVKEKRRQRQEKKFGPNAKRHFTLGALSNSSNSSNSDASDASDYREPGPPVNPGAIDNPGTVIKNEGPGSLDNPGIIVKDEGPGAIDNPGTIIKDEGPGPIDMDPEIPRRLTDRKMSLKNFNLPKKK